MTNPSTELRSSDGRELGAQTALGGFIVPVTQKGEWRQSRRCNGHSLHERGSRRWSSFHGDPP